MTSGSRPPEDQADPNDPPAHLRARIPEHVSEGVFSNGVIVMTGPSEFVIDFLQTLGRPQRLAARVVVPHAVMPQFIEALRKNLGIYQERFGPPVMPGGPPQDGRRPTPQEIYDDLKLSDAMLSGAYANGLMIGHGATEFTLDFLTSFFPQSAVSARVFLAAGQIPRVLESWQGALLQLRHRAGTGQLPPSAAPPNPQTPDPSSPHPPTTLPGAGPLDRAPGGSDPELPPDGTAPPPDEEPPSGGGEGSGPDAPEGERP